LVRTLGGADRVAVLFGKRCLTVVRTWLVQAFKRNGQWNRNLNPEGVAGAAVVDDKELAERVALRHRGERAYGSPGRSGFEEAGSRSFRHGEPSVLSL
jgi:hypothetical protein